MAPSGEEPESGRGLLFGPDEASTFTDHNPDGTTRQIEKDPDQDVLLPGDTYVPLNPLIDPHVVGSFSTTLSPRDRERLHYVIRKVHFKYYPDQYITKAEMDKLIDAWGPKVAQYELARAIESKMVD